MYFPAKQSCVWSFWKVCMWPPVYSGRIFYIQLIQHVEHIQFLGTYCKITVEKPRKHIGSLKKLQPGYDYKLKSWEENTMFFLCCISLLGAVGFVWLNLNIYSFLFKSHKNVLCWRLALRMCFCCSQIAASGRQVVFQSDLETFSQLKLWFSIMQVRIFLG